MPTSMRLCVYLAIAVAASAIASRPADAAFTFVAQQRQGTDGQFADPPGATTNINVAPSSTTIVELYLLETHSGASVLDDDDGLSSAGVALIRSEASGVGTVADSDVLINAAFDDTLFNNAIADANGGADIDAFLDTPSASTGVGPQIVDGNTAAVYIAEVTLHAPSTPGVTTFTVQDNDAQSDGTVTYADGSGIQLDDDIDASSFTVTVIPEPTSAALFAASALALSAAGRRRRRQSVPE